MTPKKPDVFHVVFNISNLFNDRELRPRPEKPEPEIKEATPVQEKAPPTKCRECRQLLDDPDLKMYPGDPQDSVSFVIQTKKQL